MIPLQALALAGITLFAAIVNGALGYGFSSLTVPLALLFLTNRVLNPAMVPIEVVLNAYVLWVSRRALGPVWRRMLPIIAGLAPGIVAGTAIVAHVNPSHLRLYTFVLLLPLILLQAAGFRRPIRSEKSASAGFGAGLGVLYAVTTISGPPLAMMLNNQGFAKQEFRAGLAFVRLAESSFTAVAYAYAGLYSLESARLVPWILPSVIIGVPLGVRALKHLKPEAFRRVCMSFDAWVVAFGISSLLRELGWIPGAEAYLVLLGVALLDGVLLYRYFAVHAAERPGAAPVLR
ncbi:MAG: sulfite exporter TauE/SafE family protein [Acidobacteria bacterium]|nr:sulfite exporter TauE/SafE family protein [Acidobacteriota bacterium]